MELIELCCQKKQINTPKVPIAKLGRKYKFHPKVQIPSDNLDFQSLVESTFPTIILAEL